MAIFLKLLAILFISASLPGNSPHQCCKCGINFSSHPMMMAHMNLAHPSPAAAPAEAQKTPPEQSPAFSCHLCSRKFKMKGSLMVHVRFVHGGARKEAKIKRSKQQQVRNTKHTGEEGLGKLGQATVKINFTCATHATKPR
jgi:hypothetical protein